MTDWTIAGRSVRYPLLIAAAILAAQLLIIGLLFKHGIDFECRANWSRQTCNFASRSLVAIYCVIAAMAMFAALRRALFAKLLGQAGQSVRPLLINLSGFVIAMLPASFLNEGAGQAATKPAFLLWFLGMGLMMLGLLRYLASWRNWGRFIRDAGASFVLVIVAGAAAPPLAAALQPVWRLETVASATFTAVTWLISLLGYDLRTDTARKIIGTDEFAISIAPVCSGVEGIALVTLFVSLFLWLFRAELRFPHAFLLYPMGIAASAILNVVRITLLLVIGLEGQPQLAVGGFHSHAGWVMFTLVALGLIAIAWRIPALHRRPSGALPRHSVAPPLRQDPAAARILPFAVFMLTAVVAPALAQNPAMFYPIRVLIVMVAVAMFLPLYRQIDWRISPLAILGGLVVGIIWVLIPVAPAEGAPPYGTISGGFLLLWYLFRGLGTVLLVPLIEELFFRDYLESKLRGAAPDQPAPIWRVLVATLISAAIFAALHDRWAEAFAAGLVFSLLTRRSGRIADAILAHAIANLVIFAVAVATGNLALI